MIMWAAPIGAFGAIAAVVGETGIDALKSLAVIMLGFYATCALFVIVILGLLLRLVAGVNLFALLRYLKREFLLIVSTSSSRPRSPAHREDGARRRQQARRRDRRPDRLLLQPGRHGDLPDDGLTVHRLGAG